MILRVQVTSIPRTGWVGCVVQKSNDSTPSWEELNETKEDDASWWTGEEAYETTAFNFRKLTRRNATPNMVLLQKVDEEGKAGDYINFSKQAKKREEIEQELFALED